MEAIEEGIADAKGVGKTSGTSEPAASGPASSSETSNSPDLGSTSDTGGSSATETSPNGETSMDKSTSQNTTTSTETETSRLAEPSQDTDTPHNGDSSQNTENDLNSNSPPGDKDQDAEGSVGTDTSPDEEISSDADHSRATETSPESDDPPEYKESEDEIATDQTNHEGEESDGESLASQEAVYDPTDQKQDIEDDEMQMSSDDESDPGAYDDTFYHAPHYDDYKGAPLVDSAPEHNPSQVDDSTSDNAAISSAYGYGKVNNKKLGQTSSWRNSLPSNKDAMLDPGGRIQIYHEPLSPATRADMDDGAYFASRDITRYQQNNNGAIEPNADELIRRMTQSVHANLQPGDNELDYWRALSNSARYVGRYQGNPRNTSVVPQQNNDANPYYQRISQTYQTPSAGLVSRARATISRLSGRGGLDEKPTYQPGATAYNPGQATDQDIDQDAGEATDQEANQDTDQVADPNTDQPVEPAGQSEPPTNVPVRTRSRVRQLLSRTFRSRNSGA
jgi:hypothetical protein